AGQRAAHVHGDRDFAFLGLDAHFDVREKPTHLLPLAPHGGHALLEMPHVPFRVFEGRRGRAILFSHLWTLLYTGPITSLTLTIGVLLRCNRDRYAPVGQW